MKIEQFVDEHRAPGQVIRIDVIHREYLATLPAEDRAKWSRGRFLNALGHLGIDVGVRESVMHAVGLTSPTSGFGVRDGRIVWNEMASAAESGGPGKP